MLGLQNSGLAAVKGFSPERTEALERILDAVGRKFIGSDLDRTALSFDLQRVDDAHQIILRRPPPAASKVLDEFDAFRVALKKFSKELHKVASDDDATIHLLSLAANELPPHKRSTFYNLNDA